MVLILVLGVGLLTAGLSAYGDSFAIPSDPVRLVIPAIGVDAKIQAVGLSKTGNGTMGIPTNFTDVAWYKKGPIPGAVGSAVIDGHLDGKHVPKAVFYNLGLLKLGDLVEVIDTNGLNRQFQVVNVRTYDNKASTRNIFSSDKSNARLDLITCAGDWIKNEKLYNQRVVVFTQLISITSASTS